MKRLSPPLVALMIFMLHACASTTHSASPFYPAIITQGVDMKKYEADRQACQADIQRAATNMESTNMARFRKCLLDKGYRLLS